MEDTLGAAFETIALQLEPWATLGDLGSLSFSKQQAVEQSGLQCALGADRLICHLHGQQLLSLLEANLSTDGPVPHRKHDCSTTLVLFF